MGLRNFFVAAADFFFPPRCLLCRKALSAAGESHFCSKCRDQFLYISGPLCPQCGIPFVSPEGEDHLCSRCISRAPLFDRARAVGEYEGSLRTAIHRFKYDSRSLLAEPLGRLLADQGRKLFISNAYDVILPVPLHPRRLRQRGFNQSLVLARQVGQQWGIAVEAEGLKRIRWTDSQTMLPVKERLHNVRGAFAYSGRGVENKAVLLIDDVYTSGSTVDECARVMKRNGAKRVDVLTVARTI
jgi:ComF family protein